MSDYFYSGRIWRIIDANINRTSEGIRVIEDILRFGFNAKELTESMRNLRHSLRKLFSKHDLNLINWRNSEKDIGKDISQSSLNDSKTNIKQLLLSNFKRLQEGLRTIEENLKIVSEYQKSKEVEKIRFQTYTEEKKCINLFRKDFPKGIYALTAEKFSKNRDNISVVKEMIKGGVSIIQYREKLKSPKEKLKECREIRKMTSDNGIMFIVNDDVDIAVLTDADGIHIGQDDLPADEVRRLVGDKIIGLSTHSPEQYRKAANSEADYIGVGPIFKTYTKENVCDPVGLEYLEFAVEQSAVPFTAIGGIKEHNIEKVLERGAETIALVTEIVEADDICEKIKRINSKIEKYKKAEEN